MSDNFAFGDDRLADDSMLDSYAAIGTELLEPEDGADNDAVQWTGVRCEKCDARLGSDGVSICRHCGWYASLNAFVEVDPTWETDLEAAPKLADASPTSVRGWIGLVPRWAW